MARHIDARAITATLLFVVLTLLFGWLLGGQAALRRLDPAFALATMPVPAALCCWILCNASPRAYLRVSLFSAGLVAAAYAALALGFASRVDGPQFVAVVLGTLAAIAGMRALSHITGRMRWSRAAFAAGALLVALGTYVAVPAILPRLYATPLAAEKPRAVMLTSLPIVWGGGSFGDIVRGRTQADPAYVALESQLAIDVRDTVPEGLPPTTVLLLAHPYALSPADLVTIDSHVREGGRALILADGLSSWEPPYGIGDPRNPPITSLLTPLLDHWGMTLEAPDEARASVTRIADGAARLELATAGRFTTVPAGCRAFGGGVGLRCAIGRGDVTLLADADLLAAARWSPNVEAGPHATRADNIDWIISEVRRLAGAPALSPGHFRPMRF